MADSDILTLITGANTGIGFELAAQLLDKGSYHVLLGSRSIDKGQAAVRKLRDEHHDGKVDFVQLDVTDDQSIAAAVEYIYQHHGHLDILVNNAAIGIPKDTEDLRAQMQQCFDTNAAGPAVLGYACEDLLKKSTFPKKRIVNISSGSGSLGRMLDPHLQRPNHYGRTIQYNTSKAALNMVSAYQAADFQQYGIRCLVWNPGFTVSNLGPKNNVENGARPVEDAVRPLLQIIEGKRDDEAHLCLNQDGGVYPW